jgi:hypothetical protein
MIIYTKGWCHHKNIIGLQLLQNINMQVSEWNGQNNGLIMLLDSMDINVINNYNKVIIGPHYEFFKHIELLNNYNGEKKIYCNVLSDWLCVLIRKIIRNEKIHFLALPFPVDIEKFTPTIKTDTYFIYFKNVHSSRLNKVIECLKQINTTLSCKMFIYGKYNESEYLDWVKSSKFGIWVGCHESQGFALQEALSCDCPLFVYDINSLKDECVGDVRYPWENFNGECIATSASYFDDSCGMIYKDSENMEEKLKIFLYNVNSIKYNPRNYIINNLSAEKCKERLLNFYSN